MVEKILYRASWSCEIQPEDWKLDSADFKKAEHTRDELLRSPSSTIQIMMVAGKICRVLKIGSKTERDHELFFRRSTFFRGGGGVRARKNQ